MRHRVFNAFTTHACKIICFHLYFLVKKCWLLFFFGLIVCQDKDSVENKFYPTNETLFTTNYFLVVIFKWSVRCCRGTYVFVITRFGFFASYIHPSLLLELRITIEHARYEQNAKNNKVSSDGIYDIACYHFQICCYYFFLFSCLYRGSKTIFDMMFFLNDANAHIEFYLISKLVKVITFWMHLQFPWFIWDISLIYMYICHKRY